MNHLPLKAQLLLSSHDGLPLPGHSARAAQEQKSGICPLKISCLFTNKRPWIGNDLYNHDLHVVFLVISLIMMGYHHLKLWKSMSETQSCDLHMLNSQVSGRWNWPYETIAGLLGWCLFLKSHSMTNLWGAASNVVWRNSFSLQLEMREHFCCCLPKLVCLIHVRSIRKASSTDKTH